ncbi:MAG: transcription antitermination factor NusB [Vicingaceae bacterium]
MLNRRLLRIKVMQSLYAYFQSENADQHAIEKNLILSIDRVYDLYLHYLILPLELADAAEVQMQEARNKALPTEEDLNPNRRFVDSYLIKALRENPLLKRKVEDRKISWGADQDEIKKLWRQIKQSDLYQQFLAGDDYPAAHRKFIDKVFDEFVVDNDNIYSNFQERSIYWDYEDNDFATHMALRYFGKIKDVDRYKPLPSMYKDEEEDKQFVKNLFKRVIKYNQDNSKYIDKKTKNWEVERIALMDVLLMKMAITEFLYFPSIPVKVTLNEYIEISKLFSTPKSKVFINGVLDKLLAEFKREGSLKKTGRGLMQ